MNRLPQSTLALVLASTFACGCAGAPPAAPKPIEKVATPVPNTAPLPSATARVKEPPPASGELRNFQFPKAIWAELPNGLSLATVSRSGAPLIELRAVVLSGSFADGERPGLAALTAKLLVEGGAGSMSGRELAGRVESMGARLSVKTGFDSTVFSLAVPKDKLSEAMDLLGAMMARPQMPPAALDGLKQREAARAEDAAREDGVWGAKRVLFDDLFSLPADHHPYASYDADAAEIGGIKLAECKSLYKKLYVPRATTVVVVGDTTPEAVKDAAEKAFKDFRGGDPEGGSFTDPNPPEERRITVVDRPKSGESEILVGVLGPERSDDTWAAFTVASELVGGPGGRLAQEFLGSRDVARAASTSLVELAHGPSVLMVHARVPAAKTGEALDGMLLELAKVREFAASEGEIASARRALIGRFGVEMETDAKVADEIARVRGLGLDSDERDGYEKALGSVTPDLAARAASLKIRMGHEAVVIAGDAEVIGKGLSRFGDVKVLDPRKGFERVRTITSSEEEP